MPRMARAVVPFHVASTPYADLYLNYFRSTAPSFGVEVVAAPVHDVAGLEALAVSAQAREPNSGIILMPSAFMSGRFSEIAGVMTKHRLPAIYTLRSFAEAGGLVSYGNDVADNYRRAASYVDRILKGDKPSELPIQFPVKFELVVNLRTARAFGLDIPATLLATADEVIE
jgi:putative ABC transport system substrate-binding protein